jgi:hypothetical protein
MRKRIFLAALVGALSGCSVAELKKFDQAYRESGPSLSEQNNAAMNEYSRAITSRADKRAPPPAVASPSPAAVTATWTGRSQPGRSITGATGYNCEYTYGGRTSWQFHVGSCPGSMQIQ